MTRNWDNENTPVAFKNIHANDDFQIKAVDLFGGFWGTITIAQITKNGAIDLACQILVTKITRTEREICTPRKR